MRYILSLYLKIRYSMFQTFALDTMRIWKANKQDTIITTHKKFLGNCIKSKKNSIKQYVSTGKNILNYLFCHIWIFSMSRKPFLTFAAPPSFHKNYRKLTSRLKLCKQKSNKVKQLIRNTFTIKLL